MKNIFFNDSVSDAEKKIISGTGVPSIVLMENAGLNSAQYISKHFPAEITGEVIILAGKGNNAGDGFVAARHLCINQIKVKVILLFKENEIKGDALINFHLLKKIKCDNLKIVYCRNSADLSKEIKEENKIIIDAVFGTGFKGQPDSRISAMISQINRYENKTVVSLDTPSCLSHYNQDFPAVKSGITLAMGVKKFNSQFYNGKKYSGKSEVISIGIPDKEFSKYNTNRIYETELSDAKSIIKKREIDSNKYSNGKVFIITGSPGLTGASYLSSMAALRSGAGAVIAGIPESLNHILEVKLTEVMTMPLPETDENTLSMKAYPEIKKKIDWADVTLIGPGISRNDETSELIRKIVKDNNKKFVLDADGIKAFKGNTKLISGKKMIITPHTGEFSALTGISPIELKDNFFEISKEFSKKHKITLVLKNAPTIITDGKSFYINPTGRENLATAGTGDVLAGMIAGFYAQTDDLCGSAISGVYFHGLCGDKLYERFGSDSTVAGDLLDEIHELKKNFQTD